jgi:hypothetical protein
MLDGAAAIPAHTTRVNRAYLRRLKMAARYPGLEIVARLARLLVVGALIAC